MDTLYKNAIIFHNLTNKKYDIYAGSKNQAINIKVVFEPKHFHHIIGLHKLTDLDIFNASLSKEKMFFKIKDKLITDTDIEKSCFYPDIADRLKYVSLLENIFDTNDFVIRFNKNMAKSSINADYVITYEIESAKLHIFLKKYEDSNECYIRSFFACDKTNDTYTHGQKKYKIIKNIKYIDGQEFVLVDKMK